MIQNESAVCFISLVHVHVHVSVNEVLHSGMLQALCMKEFGFSRYMCMYVCAYKPLTRPPTIKRVCLKVYLCKREPVVKIMYM